MSHRHAGQTAGGPSNYWQQHQAAAVMHAMNSCFAIGVERLGPLQPGRHVQERCCVPNTAVKTTLP